MPNPAIPSGFLAHAYDLGDPMDNLRPPCINQTSAAPNASAFADGTCVWPAASKWNKAVAPLKEAVQENKAPSFMGGIHPRFKHEVGRRLALAFKGTLSPTINHAPAMAQLAPTMANIGTPYLQVLYFCF